MSCLCPAYYTDEARHSRLIDKRLSLESRQMLRQVKILLLGAGETGKTTFAKQMRILYGQDYSTEDLLSYRHAIYHSLFKSMKVMLDAREKLGIEWENRRNEVKAQVLLHWKIPKQVSQELFVANVDVLARLWADDAIQQAFRRRNEYQLVGIAR